ncbi:MAG: YcfA family protein [Ignavibacteria bacterium]|nr:YcfA family protein [Ignavibacteria bacterium]
MPKYPVLKPVEISKILKLLDFEEIRQKGSHKQFKHKDGRITTLPYHKEKIV